MKRVQLIKSINDMQFYFIDNNIVTVLGTEVIDEREIDPRISLEANIEDSLYTIGYE